MQKKLSNHINSTQHTRIANKSKWWDTLKLKHLLSQNAQGGPSITNRKQGMEDEDAVLKSLAEQGKFVAAKAFVGSVLGYWYGSGSWD